MKKRLFIVFLILLIFVPFCFSRGLLDVDAGLQLGCRLNRSYGSAFCPGFNAGIKFAFIGADLSAGLGFAPGRAFGCGMFDAGLKFDIGIVRIGFLVGYKYWLGNMGSGFTFSFSDLGDVRKSIVDGIIHAKIAFDVIIGSHINAGVFGIVSTDQCIRTFSLGEAFTGLVGNFSCPEVGVKVSYSFV